MTTPAYILLGLVGAFMVFNIAYLLASRYLSLPCPMWLAWMVELDNPFAKTNRAAVIVQHLSLQSGMTVLDAGCGPGRLTIPIANQVGQLGAVVAMDVQSGMLRRTQEKALAAKITNIRFLQAALGEGKIGCGQFDRALLVTVLGEIANQEAALKEIFDSLKPGGILSVTEIIFDNHFQGRGKVSRLAAAAGFREKAFFGNRIAFILHFEKPQGG